MNGPDEIAKRRDSQLFVTLMWGATGWLLFLLSLFIP